MCKECHDGDKYEKTKCSECAYWNNGGHDDHCTDCWGENFVPSQDAKFVPNQEAKADAGKLDLTLVPTAIIEEIAKVRHYGVLKYSDPESWKKVSIDRYWKATLRHILVAWNDMTSVDEESGLLHISHASCNLAFIFALMRGETDESDNH